MRGVQDDRKAAPAEKRAAEALLDGALERCRALETLLLPAAGATDSAGLHSAAARQFSVAPTNAGDVLGSDDYYSSSFTATSV